MPPKNAPPSWLKEILMRSDNRFTKFDKFFDMLIKMQETQSLILSKLVRLEENSRSSAISLNENTSPAVYSALVKFKTDTKTIDEKACKIVWAGINEQADDYATAAFDKEALKESMSAIYYPNSAPLYGVILIFLQLTRRI
ncbi:hypothetical protein OESDEN_16334 [Oesophagostomum dentatum]|uniref:Uncharacterized protein n=1 Tax=Oesophagostomum dentatum TaxID=61180 RepID=A0A0B1SF53_OESDE|nr:hypothetical protein OESDEN_16334 [Oesophagostomum dentatum]